MRGEKRGQVQLYAAKPLDRMVPAKHPIRRLKQLTDESLGRLSKTFDEMYSKTGRPSIPPESLLKSTILMALYSIRSERQFCEQLDYNMLFRWFLDMNQDDESFDASSFSRNRERLLEHDVATKFFNSVVRQARHYGLMSEEHFSVDGTLIEAWASMKSFRRKEEEKKPPDDDPGNPTVDFHGEKRSNETHESKTDPEARLARKGNGKEAKLSFTGHALIENRNGIIVDIRVTEANGRAERETALQMLDVSIPRKKRVTLAGDRGYDTQDFVQKCRERNVTPHVAQNLNRRGGSAIDARTTRHEGYRISQRFRKRIEEVWGWGKTVACFRKTRFKGRRRTNLAALFVGTAYNLLRIANLTPTVA